MPTSYMPSAVEVLRFLPELILTAVATIVMVMSAITRQRHTLGIVALLGLVGAIAASFYAGSMPGPAFREMLSVDGFATFFSVLVFLVGILRRVSITRCCCSRLSDRASW